MSEFEHIKSIIQRALPARREIMLCKKCQIWADTIQVKSHQPPYLHCHHELEQLIEPGEKPEELCWCEMKHKVGKIYSFKGDITKSWDVLFCAHCGRKL